MCFSIKPQKIIPIDGKVQAEFNIRNEVPNTDLAGLGFIKKKYIITAIVQEKLTGNAHNSTVTIVLHKSNLIIDPINPPQVYYPGKPLIYIIAIKKLDGSPIQDKKNPVMLQIGEFKFSSVIDSKGLALFNFTLQTLDYLKVTVNYEDNFKELDSIYGTEIEEDDAPRNLHLKLKTKRYFYK